MPNAEVQNSLSRDVVRQLIKRHDRRLLDKESFSRQLSARGRTLPTVDHDTMVRLAVNLYCENWYEACNSEGDRRARAYTELARYLYDRAQHKYGNQEIAQEITHEAIILVAEQLGNCQKPGAFLAFALLKLWNAATTHFRQRDRQLERTELLSEQIDNIDGPTIELESANASPEESAIATDLTTTLLGRIGELMQQAPRARDQFKAVLLKFLYAYHDEEIARELGTEVQNVHVLRSRGIKRLREDPILKRIFEENV